MCHRECGWRFRSVDVHGTRSVVSLVDEDVNAAADGFRGGEPQPLCRARFPEEPLAGADDDRVDLEVEGVNKIVLDQRLDELRAAMNNNVAVVSLFELPDLVDDVTRENGGVVPFGVGQGLRDDVLGHDVELVRELALVVRPDGSEAVVGDPAEQKGIRVHHLVKLERVAFRAAAEGIGPADALEALISARRLDDAVEGQVLSDDDSSHLHSPFAVVLIVKFGSATFTESVTNLGGLLIRSTYSASPGPSSAAVLEGQVVACA
jgi:hypothetical protein